MLDSVPDADQRALAEYEAKRESRRKALEARGVAAGEEEEEEEECTECGQVKLGYHSPRIVVNYGLA